MQIGIGNGLDVREVSDGLCRTIIYDMPRCFRLIDDSPSVGDSGVQVRILCERKFQRRVSTMKRAQLATWRLVL